MRPDLKFRIEGINPILNVRDISASLRFYVDLLGFKNADWGTEAFTMVTKDSGGIYLCKGGQGQVGTWIWLGFDGDIYGLHEELKENGVTILMPPTNYSWALEIHIQDPDGHVIRLGTEPDPSMVYLDL